ncbi:MAG: hypothetical protein ABGZ35_12950 [Planctomycetaceae bacterium]|jgi:hypothetical protein
MKVAYGVLIVMTLIIGTRFAREFTLAVRDSRETTAQAATSGEAGLVSTEPAGADTDFFGIQPRPNAFPEPRPDDAAEPDANGSVTAVPQSSDRQDTAERVVVRHPGPLHNDAVLPGNFKYLGAIRPPHVEGLSSSFSYGGATLAYHAGGDRGGEADGFPGTLFLVGHIYDQQVAEISIPRPVISLRQSLDDLNVAELLQPFGDVSGGIQAAMTENDSQPFRIGGLQVVGNALHWTLFRYYNVEGYDFLSHGISSLSVQRPMVAGPWHLGPFQSGAAEWHAYKHAGYICEAPSSVASRLGGRTMLSGLQISTGLQTSSQGPALFAYRLPDGFPPAGTSLDATPLLWYSMERPLAGHHPADSWTGAAWLELGSKQSLVVIGRKATGPLYYGEGRPGDCSDSKGYHGPPYEAQAVVYSADELLQAANGQRQASDIQPMYRWTSESAGGSLSQYMFPTCDQSLGGLAYDRVHNVLYLVQLEAGTTDDSPFEPLPIIHVFRIVA